VAPVSQSSMIYALARRRETVMKRTKLIAIVAIVAIMAIALKKRRSSEAED
jgi:hypothetical protein